MSKISSRDIQVFVAGVLAMVLAVGIIVGSMRALRWLQIILWLGLLADFITIFMLVSGISHNVWHVSLYRVISSFLTLLTLLCLIAWSRSKRFRADGTPNTALEPTATAP